MSQPIDLRTGFDLTNPQSQKKVLDILEKQSEYTLPI